MRPRQPCSRSGCPNLRPCAVHPVVQWQPITPTKRTTGRKLQAARERLYFSEPRCRQCKKLLTIDTMIRDHVIPLAEGGPDTEDNTQPLCQGCSDAKTAEESRRGKARVGGFTPPTTSVPRITVVCGPSGSGKTHYVTQHRKPGDLVWDYDVLAEAIAQYPTYPRPPHVLDCMETLWTTFLRIAAQTPACVFLIVASRQVATEVVAGLPSAVMVDAEAIRHSQ